MSRKPPGKPPQKPPAKPRSTVDWEAVERDYRAGLLSLREMATAHSVSHVAITKHARAKGWARDLNAKIKAKADALVNRAEVTGSVNSVETVTDRQMIEAGALRIATVRHEHRSAINRARELAMKLLGEVEHQTEHGDLFEKLGELMYAPDKNGVDKRRDAYDKVIGLAGRVTNLKALAEALKNLVALEREAYTLDKIPEDGDNRSRSLSNAERASRLATLLERARQAAGQSQPPNLSHAAPPSDVRH